MRWAPQQETALQRISQWLKSGDKPFFYLGGYAGTGKTTLAVSFSEMIDGDAAFSAFTGKAASVLQRKSGVPTRTIHSTIYDVKRKKSTGELQTKLKSKQELGPTQLIVIDECSMVDDRVGQDLLSYGIPVLVLGDPAQLSPIKGQGFFTRGEPDFMLTDVHRQAEESPIIRVATQIRNGDFCAVPMSEPGFTMGKKVDVDPERVKRAGALICGKNDTRINLNKWMRGQLGFRGTYPIKGETLICLRNNHPMGISNGQTFSVVRSANNHKDLPGTLRYFLSDEADDQSETVYVDIPTQFFEDEVSAARNKDWWPAKYHHFTYGYALTCHKSQGSQWDNVCVFDESWVFADQQREWLYTAVTRAAKTLTLIY